MNKKLKHNQKGLAAIELTLLLPFLLFSLFVVTEFARVLYQYNALTKVVRNASRYIIANPEFNSTNGNIVTNATTLAAKSLLIYGDLAGTQEILPNLSATTFSVSVADEFITVTASYPWQPIFTSSLPKFASSGSYDLSFPLVTRYTMRALP
ncbi:MAG TPA: TadE/TadG family type IV pilus assembly protein [Psychromonas sp.]